MSLTYISSLANKSAKKRTPTYFTDIPKNKKPHYYCFQCGTIVRYKRTEQIDSCPFCKSKDITLVSSKDAHFFLKPTEKEV